MRPKTAQIVVRVPEDVADQLRRAYPDRGARSRKLRSLIERHLRSIGLKRLIDYFDGREGEPVAPSTISRWRSEPTRCPAWALQIFVDLDPAFRAQLFALLLARLSTSDELLRALPPDVAAQVSRTQERLVLRHLRALELRAGLGTRGVEGGATLYGKGRIGGWAQSWWEPGAAPGESAWGAAGGVSLRVGRR